MRVLITGGTGKVGKAVVEEFIRRDWETRVIGLETDVADLREQMRGCQVVVHLAAISHPMRTPSPTLFQVNATGTFNVFEAASAEGIRRVVQASSINAYGCFWGTDDISPAYFPISEDLPTHTTDVYSFSKAVIEDIGAYYWRRDGISSVAFRLPGVWNRSYTTSEHFQQRRQAACDALDVFVKLSRSERQVRMDRIQEAIRKYRNQRMFEYPQASNGFQLEALESSLADEPLWSQYLFERFNFWAYIDERDVGFAMEKAARAEFEGSHPLFISAKNNSLNYKSMDLIDCFFPKVSVVRYFYDGPQTLVSFRKARELIGFRPEFTLVT